MAGGGGGVEAVAVEVVAVEAVAVEAVAVALLAGTHVAPYCELSPTWSI